MQEHSDVYAYFWAEGFPGTSAQVTALMGIEPSETRAAGDLSGSGRVVQSNQWVLRSPLVRGDHPIQDYLEALLPLLESRSSAVRRLAEGCSIGINCVGYYYGANPGLHLSAQLIGRLAALGVAVDFDLYNHAGEDAP
jgi:hypothetical protein